MRKLFFERTRHHVGEANINFYKTPFVHPKRKMREHDFIYMLEGEWKIGQNGETLELQRDTLAILRAGEVHYGISPCSPGSKTMYFHVSCEAGDTEEGGHLVESLYVPAGKTVKRLFSEIVRAKLSGDERRADLYFEVLLYELAERTSHEEDGGIALKMKNIIHESPESFYSNAELARRVNVSVKTAETRFKATFGMTIHSYMLDFKIKEAISYFETFPEMSIKEIAHNLGFYDEYHFSKQFKKTVGVPPTVYKKSK